MTGAELNKHTAVEIRNGSLNESQSPATTVPMASRNFQGHWFSQY